MQTVAVVLGIDADAPDTEGKYHKTMCCDIIFLFKFAHYRLKKYRRLHLSLDTRQKPCSRRVPDMACFVTKHLKFDSC